MYVYTGILFDDILSLLLLKVPSFLCIFFSKEKFETSTDSWNLDNLFTIYNSFIIIVQNAVKNTHFCDS